jgi:hypothetical protein
LMCREYSFRISSSNTVNLLMLYEIESCSNSVKLIKLYWYFKILMTNILKYNFSITGHYL